MVMRPWSTRTSVNWRRTLRFYERRYEILREIEDTIGISAYRREEDLVGARLPGDGGVIELTPSSLMFQTRRADADAEQLMTAVAMTLKAMEYPRPTEVETSMQHLEPLDDDFPTAITRAVQAVLGGWSTVTGLADFGLLYDGVWKGRTYQAEFGILSKEQVSLRIQGWVSRIAPGNIAEDVPEPAPASLYVDSHWTEAIKDDGEQFSLDTYYADTVTAGGEVAEALMGAIK